MRYETVDWNLSTSPPARGWDSAHLRCAWRLQPRFMQQLEDRGEPAWIGNCNELNASYATDAYTRINGIGALIVTHGVGALSAINGIAGAYSEHVPVILISGSLPLRSVQRGDL